ncbi:MAG: hypothetical protein PHW72_00740 [Candidatus Pacebacteria bacterium]|nr:hypothetical protein [Candidatus Paceibacterota bacterium]
MINLLPQLKKEELRQEENWKLIIVLGIFALFFLISLSLIFFSIENYILGESKVQKIILSQKEKEFENSNIKDLNEKLINFNQTVSRLDYFYGNQKKIGDILSKISETVPLGVVINNLSLGLKSKKFTCGISGSSPNRELLLEFKENLEENESFKDINFPPGSWVESKDIDFALSFSVDE